MTTTQDTEQRAPVTGPPQVSVATTGPDGGPEIEGELVFAVRDVVVRYGGVPAIEGVHMDIRAKQITALIGPSGCGKSTFLRCFNRMNDLVQTARIDGSIMYHSHDLYSPGVDAVEVRRRIGMVFQKP
ncbi:MAG: ATP-binding cassette domain-containing protein, partial [Acidimicrobiia bacterium]